MPAAWCHGFAEDLSAAGTQGPVSTSFIKFAGDCKTPRNWQNPVTGLPCREAEETSCNLVHATCAKVPKVGWKPDAKDPLSFEVPKGSCELPAPKLPPLGGGSWTDLAGQVGDTIEAVGNAVTMVQSMLAGSATNSECNARMAAESKSGLGGTADKLLSFVGAEKQMKVKLPLTVWGQAVHGMSGTWSFDSGGLHSTDYVYKVEQGKGAPDDFYLCDARDRPQHCALLGGNLKHACAAWYDPKQCDFCEDLGDELKCDVRGWNHKDLILGSLWQSVPIYPRDLLGELYRGEWKDVWMRPVFASVRLKKAGLMGEIKKLPDQLVTTGPGSEAMNGIPGIAQPPFAGFSAFIAVDRISLPSLWLERSVLALVVYLRHSSSFTENTEVRILRGSGQDRWCAEGNRAVAAGRVGKLRGPSAICIDAILETNLEALCGL
eukprot:s556_g6.t1